MTTTPHTHVLDTPGLAHLEVLAADEPTARTAAAALARLWPDSSASRAHPIPGCAGIRFTLIADVTSTEPG